eukprot:1656839-Prymnesium_polylepis.1
MSAHSPPAHLFYTRPRVVLRSPNSRVRAWRRSGQWRRWEERRGRVGRQQVARAAVCCAAWRADAHSRPECSTL